MLCSTRELASSLLFPKIQQMRRDLVRHAHLFLWPPYYPTLAPKNPRGINKSTRNSASFYGGCIISFRQMHVLNLQILQHRGLNKVRRCHHGLRSHGLHDQRRRRWHRHGQHARNAAGACHFVRRRQFIHGAEVVFVVFHFFFAVHLGWLAVLLRFVSSAVLGEIVRSREGLVAVRANIGSFLSMCSDVSLEMLEALEQAPAARDRA